MKTMILVLMSLVLLGCGNANTAIDPQDNRDLPQVTKNAPVQDAVTLCELGLNAPYCDDEGAALGSHPNVVNSSFIGLFAQFSVSAGSSNNYGRLVEIGGDHGPGGGAALTVSGSDSNLTVDCAWWDSGIGVTAIGAPISVGDHAVYCDVNSSSARLFVDGVLATSVSSTYFPTTGSIGVGVSPNSSSFDFIGDINEAAVFNSALSDSEILQISQ